MRTAKQIYNEIKYSNIPLSESDKSILARDPKYAYLYAKHINKPFAEGEASIRLNEQYSKLYNNKFSKPIGFNRFTESLENALNPIMSTAVEIKPCKRWPLSRQSVKKVADQLIDSIDREFDLDSTDVSPDEMVKFIKRFNKIKEHSLDHIKKSDLDKEIKKQLITKISKTTDMESLFHCISYLS